MLLVKQMKYHLKKELNRIQVGNQPYSIILIKAAFQKIRRDWSKLTNKVRRTLNLIKPKESDL